MSINPIANSPSAESSAQPTAQAVAKSSAPHAAAPAPSTTRANDTVQVSSAAKALLQESQETSAQTTREASSGDQQAVRLLARRAATKAGIK